MKRESEGFDSKRLGGFLDELRDRDRVTLAERLERASARLAELAPRVGDPPEADGASPDWNAKEVLAHIAVLSKFYGVLAYRIGSGTLTELDFLGQVRQRDATAEGLLKLPAAAIAESARKEHRRTLAWLAGATPADLVRRCELGDERAMTAEEVLRLPLCAHLELHLDQLEQALAG
jgi:hypothetical protein